MKLIHAQEKDLDKAMSMISMAKQHLKDQNIDQWQQGYPDEACIQKDIADRKGYFYQDDAGEYIGYVCIDFDGEPAYDHLNGEWKTEIAQNSMVAQDQDEYEKRYRELYDKYEAAKGTYETACTEIETREGKRTVFTTFIGALREKDSAIEAFDEEFWSDVIDYLEVATDGNVEFLFKNGTSITV